MLVQDDYGASSRHDRRELRAFDVMSHPPETIETDASVYDAASQMAISGIGFLPVCEAGGAVGVLTDRDVTVRVVAVGRDPRTTRVRDVMTRPVYRCFADTLLSEARQMLRANCVRRLVVTDPAYRVVGVLSIDDLKALASRA